MDPGRSRGMRRRSAASSRYTPAFTVSVVIGSPAPGFSRNAATRPSASVSTSPYWRGGGGGGGGGGAGAPPPPPPPAPAPQSHAQPPTPHKHLYPLAPFFYTK